MTAEGWKGFCYNIAHWSSAVVLPSAEFDERPEVMYKPSPNSFIEVGMAAFIFPVNHYATTRVTNENPAITGKVVAYDEATGAFETKNTRYVLDVGCEH